MTPVTTTHRNEAGVQHATTTDASTSVRECRAAESLAEPPEMAPGATRASRKVCFISPLGDGLYRSDRVIPYGGAELQFYLLSRELAADPAFEVAVVTTVDGNPGLERRGAVTLVRRLAKGRLARNRSLRARALREYVEAFGDLYALFRRMDADVYLHAGAGVEVGAYALAARLLRRRFIFVVASSADVREPYGMVEGPLKWLYPLGLRLADGIVCRTREQAAWLRARYGRDGTLIRTGHPTEAALDQGRTAVLWSGRIHPLKQPQRFLDLAECLRGDSCVMVAMRDPGHEDLWEAVRRRASALPNVAFHANVPWSETGALFAQAKVLVNTSTYEGFPNTFVEAGMHGTPILSLIVDPDRVLSEHGIGRCAGGVFDRLVSDARALCASEATRADYAQRARAYALAHHDIKNAARELKTLVRSLPASRSASPETRCA